jgi:hypothetical protein
MVLKTHNLDVLENVFGEVDKPIFQGVERPCEFFFCILGIEISDLNEVV